LNNWVGLITVCKQFHNLATMLLFQVSADDRRHLCERTKLSSDVGLSAYGSVVYQLKDANIEASGTCDFVCRALRIVYRTGEPPLTDFLCTSCKSFILPT